MRQQAIRSEIERAVIYHYPEGALVIPTRMSDDVDFRRLKAVLAELRRIDPAMKPGTDARFDISEEWVLIDTLHLHFSYIGPFAALNYRSQRELDEDEREVAQRIERVLDQHGITLLGRSELEEQMPWIRRGRTANVWSCLFLLPED